MPELSIIVPVYKVEPYLRRCIDSILAQTFRDFELILIDDGSPDNCGAICDEYAAKDSRIIVIHQKNQGVSAARNAGLDIARGTYLGFVDSDDWIEPEMYETMIATAKEKQVDVVVCGIKYQSDSGEFIRDGFTAEAEFTQATMLQDLYGKPSKNGCGVVNKVFRAQSIEATRFEMGVKIAEDWQYLFYAFTKCQSAVKIRDTFYTVVERMGSATRNEYIPLENYISSYLASSLLLLLSRNYSFELESYAIDKYLDDCLRYTPLIKKAAKNEKRPYIGIVLKIKRHMISLIAKAWVKEMLPKNKLRGYLLECVKL